jgi:hypothetical protein
LEEAIKFQKTLDPIPTKRASGPDKAKEQTTPWLSQPTQVQTTREAPLGLSLKEMLIGTRVPVGGQPSGSEGTKQEVVFGGPLTKPLAILTKEEERRGESQVTTPFHCRSVVGGRLQDFTDFWDTWCPKDLPVPGIIRHGLHLDFVSQPPTTSVPSPVHLPQDSAKASALRAEVKSLQDNGVIVPIDNPGPGFYSHIFVVPKKHKGFWKLIIDLSRLSRFLRVPHFKMETTRSVAAAILPGDWI